MNGEARVSIYLELKNKANTAMAQAKQYLAKNVEAMKADLKDLKLAHAEALSSMKDEIPGLGRAMELATNPYVLAAAAVVGLGASFKHASDMAQEFDSKMAHANVTLQLSKPELQKASSQVLDIAARSTTKDAVNAAPDALNIFASANLSDDPLQNYKLSLAAVEPTLKAVKWGYSDVETAARAAALSMSASKIDDVNRVYDILAATLNKGNAEFGTIAQYLPKLIGQAHDAGINFEQTAGAYAFMTHTLSGEKSSTMLENVIKALGDTSKLQNFRDIGVDVFDKVTHKMNPLVTTISQLKHALGGLNDLQRAKILGSLGIDQESRAGLSTMINDVAGLKASIDGTTNSAGQAQIAFDNAKTSLDGWERITNDTKTAWTRLGHAINETVYGPLGDWIVKNSSTLELLAYMVAGGALAWGIYTLATNAAAISTGIMTAAQWALNVALTANPIGMIVFAVGALIAGLIYAYKHSENFRASVDGLLTVVGNIGSYIYNDIITPIAEWIKSTHILHYAMIPIKLYIQGIAAYFTFVKSVVTEIGSYLIKLYNHTLKPIIDLVADSKLFKALQNGYNTGHDKSIAESKAATAKEGTAALATDKKPTNLYEKDKPTKESLSKLEDIDKKKRDKESSGITGGDHVRNITINKIVFAEHLNTTNPEMNSMSPSEMERWFNEFLQRAVLNLARN